MKKFLIERIGDRTVVLSDVNRDEPSKIELALQYNSLIDRAEAAEARAAQLQAERDTLEQRVRELDDEVERLRNATNNTIRVFERMASLDWRTDGETPLGQALDGLGDEVEP